MDAISASERDEEIGDGGSRTTRLGAERETVNVVVCFRT